MNLSTDNDATVAEVVKTVYASDLLVDSSDSGHLVGRLQDKLELFENDDFDVEAFTQEYAAHLTEKGLNALRGDLVTLQDHCEEEVHAESYKCLFICGYGAMICCKRKLENGSELLTKQQWS